jgi:toxin ParE1/3/4
VSRKWPVIVAPGAAQDIEEIRAYIAARDGLGRAEKVLGDLEERIAALETQPLRGHAIPELAGMGAAGKQQVHFKPYRIIYDVTESQVEVLVVSDGRRDMRGLLATRFLQ